MGLADSSSANLSFRDEPTTWGVVTAGAYQEMRIISESLKQETRTAESEEVGSDRLTPDIVRVGADVSGDIVQHLSWGEDDLLKYAQMRNWTAAYDQTATCSATANGDGTWLLEDDATPAAYNAFIAGGHVRMSGWTFGGSTANNGIWRILEVQAGVGLLLDDGDNIAVTSAADAGVRVIHESLVTANATDTGNTSFSVQKNFPDSDESSNGTVITMNGFRVDTMALAIESEAIPKVTYGVRGKIAIVGDTLATGANVAPGTGEVMNAVDHIELYSCAKTSDTGAPYKYADVKSLTLTMNNALRPQPIIGSVSPVGIGRGTQRVTIAMTAYFRDNRVLDDYLGFKKVNVDYGYNETTPAATTRTGGMIVCEDTLGNAYVFDIGQAVITKADTLTPGKDQDIMVDIEMTAFKRKFNATSSPFQFGISRIVA